MNLYYQRMGSGDRTLVFLHYFGGAGNSWEAVISYLQKDFQCIAVDMLGFGKSPSQDTLISVDDSANAVLNLINELLLQDYILIGHSMGGKIALNIASMQPKGLLSLVLIAPSPPTPEPMTDKEREGMNEAFGDRNKVEKMIKNVIAHPLSKEAFDKEVINNLSVSNRGWHSWPTLGSKENIAGRMDAVHVPVTVIYGGSDKKFTKKFLKKKFDQYFTTFGLVEIKDGGHLLPIEAAEEVAEEIKKII